MSLFKICSRTLTKRILQQHGAVPVYFSLSRNFSNESFKDKMDSIRDDFYDKVGELSDSLPNNAVKIDPELEEKAAKEEFGSMRDNLKSSPTAQELSKTSPESFFKENFEPAGRDAYEQLDAKDEFLPLRARVGNMDEDEVDRAVEFVSKRPSIVGETVHDYLPFREKGKASDPGESWGPAKAEFDSWKRIYKEEATFERLGLPPRAHYWRDGEMFSPFGTLSNPVKVYSQFSHRIVGCRGGNGKAHEIVWINLGTKYKTMCPECGQMFMLVNYRPEEAEEPGEDLHDQDKVRNDGQLKEPQFY